MGLLLNDWYATLHGRSTGNRDRIRLLVRRSGCSLGGLGEVRFSSTFVGHPDLFVSCFF